jgi:hypothetical protein
VALSGHASLSVLASSGRIRILTRTTPMPIHTPIHRHIRITRRSDLADGNPLSVTGEEPTSQVGESRSGFSARAR